MKINRWFVIILLLLISLNLLAGEKVVLIDLTQVKNLNVLEEMKLNLLLENQSSIMVCIEDEKQLRDKKIPFQLIANDIDAPLYLLSSKHHKDMNPFIEKEKVVYQDNHQLIVNDPQFSIDQYIKKNIKAVKLEKSNRVYKNQKLAYQKDIRTILPVDQNVINAINADSIAYFIQGLQDFQTRYAFHPNRFEVSEWIRDQFIRMGYTGAYVDSFYHANYGVWQKNVIAVKPGTELVDQYVLIGGHHDSILNSGYENSMIFAPGADDNASGTAAVLEIARAMKQVNYNSKVTIRFCTYAMEELGLWGSKYDAYVSANNQVKIRAMVNNDMIASQISPNWVAHLQTYTTGMFLKDLAIDFIDEMPNLDYVVSNTNTSGSDSWSYWQYGYPSIFLAESEFSPYYHTTNDLIEYCNMPYAQLMVKLAASMVMYMAEIPTTPENFFVRDAGNGQELQAVWSAIPDQGNVVYHLQVKNTQSNQVQEFSTSNTSYTITGLSSSITYDITLTAKIGDKESIAVIRSASPEIIPYTVDSFHILPRWNGIQINWYPNSELDITGYRIYQSVNENELGTEVSFVNHPANTYLYSPSNNYTLFYYRIKAVDQQGNMSEMTDAIAARPFTMNHGILILDDTYNGTGSVSSPTDQQVDTFYSNMFSNFDVSHLEISNLNRDVNIFDLCAYSLVVYHRNSSNSSNIIPYTDALKTFLDEGGKLIISAYKASQIFSHYPGYPATFNTGLFVRDYLKIQSSSFNAAARFKYADGYALGFADIYCDSLKTHPNLAYRIKDIESISASSQGTAIYSYQSDYDSGNAQAVMDGSPVAVLYNGNDYKTLTLSFPLYNMKDAEAQAMIDRTIEIWGGIQSNEETPQAQNRIAVLHHNYPNPFNPSTTLSYTLKQGCDVTLNIYNIKGQIVRSYHQGFQNQGLHEIVWNGKDESQKEMSSGVYFYQLQASNSSESKKMILIK